MDKIRQYIYYTLIGVLSFLALAFLPLVGSSQVGLGWGFPDTTAGWIVWAASRVAVSVLNVLIFHCFVRQGDLNTQDNEDRKEAEKILNKINQKKSKTPISPTKFFAKEYGKKVPSIFIMSIVSLIAFGPIFLVFDVAVFLAYLFTVIMSIIFGILEMKKVERYFIRGLLKYAKYVESLEKTDIPAVSISIPNSSQTKSKDISLSSREFKGIIAHKEDLPIRNNYNGDYYYVGDKDHAYEVYLWCSSSVKDGSKYWLNMGYACEFELKFGGLKI